jgi:hypothetical protein
VDIPEMIRSLQVIDKALDAGQAGLASVLGRADPDGDREDLEPAPVPSPGDEQRAMQRHKLLLLLRTRDLMKV